jgi:hypothetical protein
MYPLHFTGDLAAVARSIAGLIATDPAERTALLRDAIEASPNSRSQQLDHLRVLLAWSMMEQGNPNGALSILRTRARDQAASSELLRALAAMIAVAKSGFAATTRTPAEFRERERLLRRAAEDRSDVQRPQTLYNLAGITDLRDPQQRTTSERIYHELLQSRSHYANAWYVRRDLGAAAWQRAKHAERQGNPSRARAAYLEAGQWYRRAIRARRRGQFFLRDAEGDVLLYFRYPPSPILYANAAEAFGLAGQQGRYLRYEHDFQNSRRKLRRLGLKRWSGGKVEAAYALLEWTIVGRHDKEEAELRAWVAALLWQLRQDAEARTMWAHAAQDSPSAAADALARIRDDPAEFPIDRALPF